MSDQQNFRYGMRLLIISDDKFFGSGICCLLELIAETGSLTKACRQMGMAYSKAWRIIKRAEEVIGAPLILGISGGKGGGSSVLSPLAKDWVGRYRAFEADTQKAASALFERHFKDLLQTEGCSYVQDPPLCQHPKAPLRRRPEPSEDDCGFDDMVATFPERECH